MNPGTAAEAQVKSMKEKLLGKSLEELKEAAQSCSLKPFVGRQLADWLYGKRVRGWDGMANISKAARERLAERFELGVTAPEGSLRSCDGTVKYLFPVSCAPEGSPHAGEDRTIEAVVIPDDERRTLCVSSQSGCRMGCRFCMTGRNGFRGSLDRADILNQFVSIDESLSLSNAVFMGMGEPLDNYAEVSAAIEVLTADWGFGWSPKRITLSTVGVIPVLKRYLDEQRCHIAVSLHNPFHDERLEMMPAEKAWPAADVVALLREYDFSGQRRVSFEYTMFSGFNDDKRHADALIRMLRGLECRVNLIRFHKIPDFPYESSSDRKMEEFRNRLNNNGILCTIRSSRGEDIFAACGLLAGQRSARH